MTAREVKGERTVGTVSLQRLTVVILEACGFDPKTHDQDVGGGAEAVNHHPKKAGIECRDRGGSF